MEIIQTEYTQAKFLLFLKDGDAMGYQVFCQNTKTGTMYDISTLVPEVTHDTTIDGTPGKCTFTVRDDPNGILEIANGSIITFLVDNIGIFYGYVFSMEFSEDGSNKIIAYDQIRYLKNKEIYITSGMTASQIFEQVCQDNIRTSQFKVVTPSVWVPEDYVHRGTLYETIKYGIDRSIINETGKHYFIRDNYGVLEFTELAQYKTNIIIGDKSLLSSYTYNISIDKDVYNTIKVTRDNEKTGRIESWVVFDSNTQAQWGKLQTIEEADSNLNEAQIAELANNYLKLRNKESQTMKLSAIGVPELIAGSGFTLEISKLKIRQDMWITTASHKYKEGYHSMELSVSI